MSKAKYFTEKEALNAIAVALEEQNKIQREMLEVLRAHGQLGINDLTKTVILRHGVPLQFIGTEDIRKILQDLKIIDEKGWLYEIENENGIKKIEIPIDVWEKLHDNCIILDNRFSYDDFVRHPNRMTYDK